MNITGINKSRLQVFVLLVIFFVMTLFMGFLHYNLLSHSFFFLGLTLFIISIASILEKVFFDIILKTIHDKNKSSMYLYISMKTISILGSILIFLLFIGILFSVYFYIEEGSKTYSLLLFCLSASLLNVSFLLDTGRLVFINNEYIIYHQGLYKKVVAYQHTDASVICIVEDGKKRQKTAAIKFKNLETRSKVIEDFVKNGLKEECE